MFTFRGTIPVTIHPVFFFVAALIGWINSGTIEGMFLWIAIVFVSVLVHEYGHALTAYIFGQKPKIQLVGFGGLTTREGKGKLQLWQEFVIVFNGPFFGLLLALFSSHIYTLLQDQETLFSTALQITVLVNIFWTVVNLVPIYPLDGGHLLRIVLEGAFGHKGVRIAIFLGMILSVCASLFFFSFGLVIAGALFLILAFENFKSWKITKSMTAQDRSHKFQQQMRQVDELFTQGQTREAFEKCQDIRLATSKGMIFHAATVTMARILHQHEDYEEAFELLSPLQKSLVGEERLLFHRIAYGARKWEAIAKIGDEVFREYSTTETAIINAAAQAALGNVRPSVGWLKYAEGEGAEGLRSYVKDSAFEPIRKEKEFQEWVGLSNTSL